MSQLILIEHKGQRVLMSDDLANSLGADEKRISENFNRNKVRHSENKHFFLLQGSELKAFKEANPQIAEHLKYASSIYLWTKKGAWMHAKSLNTDEAWDAYEALVDDYYEKIDRFNAAPILQMTPLEMLAQLAQQAVEKERADAERDREVKSLRSGFETLTDNLTAVPDAAKVRDLLNEYHRWTRIDHDQIYTSIYETLLEQHGIDVPRRTKSERERVDEDYHDRTGRHYAEKTLKQKVTGIDVMVRMGVLDKFYSILVGLLAKAKSERKL